MLQHSASSILIKWRRNETLCVFFRSSLSLRNSFDLERCTCFLPKSKRAKWKIHVTFTFQWVFVPFKRHEWTGFTNDKTIKQAANESWHILCVFTTAFLTIFALHWVKNLYVAPLCTWFLNVFFKNCTSPLSNRQIMNEQISLNAIYGERFETKTTTTKKRTQIKAWRFHLIASQTI